MNLTLLGRPEDAIVPLQEAIRLDPLEPRTPYMNVLGISYYAAGRYTEALGILEGNIHRSGPRGPQMDIFIAASYAQLGRAEEARGLLREMIRAYPEFPAEDWLSNWLQRGDALQPTLELLRELGFR